MMAEDLYMKLPSETINRSGNLIGTTTNSNSEEGSKRQIRELLEKHVPFNDQKEICDELKKTICLKPFARKNKTHKAHNTHPIGKNRLSGRTKKKLGLHKLNKYNKTYKIFLPLHELWKKYVVKALDLENLVKNGWKCSHTDPKTENFQNKLKKIEYFGCFLKVSKSKCSEYIGKIGIVIKDTKNTFVIITPEDKVKIIPKLHSEFSFVVENIGFSILGSHLQQRPVERSKNPLKKHSLWL